MRPGALRAAGRLLAAARMVPGWYREAAGSPEARAREQRFLAEAARAFVRDVRVVGGRPAGPGTLYVANHQSWLDVPVLAAALGTRFVSKAEVARWPVVGALARRSGTLFVSRDKRGEAGAQAQAIAARLAAGDSLVLFAEGGTSDGTGVLPFRSSLFAAALAARSIQPVAIGYRDREGRPLEGAALARFVWCDEEALLPNMARVARAGASAAVRLMPPIVPGGHETRKDLAARCHWSVAMAQMMLRDTSMDREVAPA